MTLVNRYTLLKKGNKNLRGFQTFWKKCDTIFSIVYAHKQLKY